ncbi:MAG: pitrilysin family protein [Anaerolineaceae bacterium]|jgi:zinc protease|nr:pitrilysin family protein [Anaerolineaceae bacterium]
MTINIHSLPGPENIIRRQLDNGITVLIRTNPDSPSIYLNGFYNGGSIFDPAGQLGLADFTALALMRGSQQHNFQELYDLLETAGASLSFDAAVHNARFAGRALAEDLPLLLNLLAECLIQPAFPPEQLEILRAQLFTGLTMRNQDTGSMAALRFEELLYGSHPYSRPVEGHLETLPHIQRDDLIDFHQKYYGPRGMTIVIVGSIDPEAAFALVQQALGSWHNPAQIDMLEAATLPAFPAQTIRQHVELPGKSQSDLIIGWFGPMRNSPDYLPLSVGNNILGQFGMMGRIGSSVREKAGLAYYASTSLGASLMGGSWLVAAGVNPTNLERAIDLILVELERFTKETVSDEELNDSKANFTGRLPMAFESNAGVASGLWNIERYQLGLDYYQLYPQRIAAINAEQILETTRRYLDPQRLVIVDAGTNAGGMA